VFRAERPLGLVPSD